MARLFLLFIVSFLLPGATYSQPSKTTKEKNEKPTAYSVLYNAGYKFFETLDPGYIAPNNKERKIEPKIKIKNKKKNYSINSAFLTKEQKARTKRKNRNRKKTQHNKNIDNHEYQARNETPTTFEFSQQLNDKLRAPYAISSLLHSLFQGNYLGAIASGFFIATQFLPCNGDKIITHLSQMAGGSYESYILANDVDATNHTSIENFKGTFNMSKHNIDNLRTCLFAKIINDAGSPKKHAINAGRFRNAKIRHIGNQGSLGVIACETEGDIGLGDIDLDHCDVTAVGGNSHTAGLLFGESFYGDIAGTNINAHDCTITSTALSGALMGLTNGLTKFDRAHLKNVNVKSKYGHAGAIGHSDSKVVFLNSIIEESSFSSRHQDVAVGAGRAKEFHLIGSTLKDNKISLDVFLNLNTRKVYRAAAAVASSQKTVIKDSTITNNRISCTTKGRSLCTSAEICPRGTISKEGHNNYVCCNLLVSQGGRGSTTTHQNTRNDMNCSPYTNSSSICDFRSKPVTRSSPSTNTNTNANINATSPTDSNASTSSTHFSGSDTTNPMTMNAAPEWAGSAIGGTVVAGAALALTTGYVGRTFYNHWHGKTWSESAKEPFTTSYNAAKNCFTSCADWFSSSRNDEPSFNYNTLE